MSDRSRLRRGVRYITTAKFKKDERSVREVCGQTLQFIGGLLVGLGVGLHVVRISVEPPPCPSAVADPANLTLQNSSTDSAMNWELNPMNSSLQALEYTPPLWQKPSTQECAFATLTALDALIDTVACGRHPTPHCAKSSSYSISRTQWKDVANHLLVHMEIPENHNVSNSSSTYIYHITAEAKRIWPDYRQTQAQHKEAVAFVASGLKHLALAFRIAHLQHHCPEELEQLNLDRAVTEPIDLSVDQITDQLDKLNLDCDQRLTDFVKSLDPSQRKEFDKAVRKNCDLFQVPTWNTYRPPRDLHRGVKKLGKTLKEMQALLGSTIRAEGWEQKVGIASHAERSWMHMVDNLYKNGKGMSKVGGAVAEASARVDYSAFKDEANYYKEWVNSGERPHRVANYPLMELAKKNVEERLKEIFGILHLSYLEVVEGGGKVSEEMEGDFGSLAWRGTRGCREKIRLFLDKVAEEERPVAFWKLFDPAEKVNLSERFMGEWFLKIADNFAKLKSAEYEKGTVAYEVCGRDPVIPKLAAALPRPVEDTGERVSEGVLAKAVKALGEMKRENICAVEPRNSTQAQMVCGDIRDPWQGLALAIAETVRLKQKNPLLEIPYIRDIVKRLGPIHLEAAKDLALLNTAFDAAKLKTRCLDPALALTAQSAGPSVATAQSTGNGSAGPSVPTAEEYSQFYASACLATDDEVPSNMPDEVLNNLRKFGFYSQGKEAVRRTLQADHWSSAPAGASAPLDSFEALFHRRESEETARQKVQEGFEALRKLIDAVKCENPQAECAINDQHVDHALWKKVATLLLSHISDPDHHSFFCRFARKIAQQVSVPVTHSGQWKETVAKHLENLYTNLHTSFFKEACQKRADIAPSTLPDYLTPTEKVQATQDRIQAFYNSATCRPAFLPDAIQNLTNPELIAIAQNTPRTKLYSVFFDDLQS